MEQEKEWNFGEWVEANRVVIGSILIVLILISGSFLLWRENYFKPTMEKQLEGQEIEIKELKLEIETMKGQISDITKLQSEAKVSSPAIASDLENNIDSSKVAATTQSQSSIKNVALPVAIPGKINLNTASLAQLDSLSGIGPTYAQRIIDYREQNGGFKSIEEVMNVKGIGEKTFEKFREKIAINWNASSARQLADR